MHLHLGALETEFGRQPHRLAAAVAEQLGAHGWLPAAVDIETRPNPPPHAAHTSCWNCCCYQLFNLKSA
jgi:hypothetical protein